MNILCFRNASNIIHSRLQQNDLVDKNYFNKFFNQNTYSLDTLSRKDQLQNLLDALNKQTKNMNRH